MAKEVITIVTEMVDLVSGKTKKMTESIESLGGGVQKSTKQIGTMNGAIFNQQKTVTKTTKGLRKFKFEWLGVMFAGMALYRVFGGLIKAQMDLFGISEMLSATWMIVLLPVMEWLADLLYPILGYFMDLPTPVKILIGAFVLLAAVVGLFLMVIGQVMLGVASIVMAWPILGVIATAIGGVIAGSLGIIIAVIAVVVAFVIGMYLAWKSNFLGMKKTVSDFVNAVKGIFTGIVKVFKGVMNIVKGLFTGDFELIKKGIVQIFVGLGGILMNLFWAIGAGITAIFKGALMIVYNMVKAVIDGIIWVAGKVSKFFGGGDISFRMPSLQKGGIIPETGPYFLHKNETVVPAGDKAGGFSPTININATVSSSIDMRRLAEEINRTMSQGYSNLSLRRGVI